MFLGKNVIVVSQWVVSHIVKAVSVCILPQSSKVHELPVYNFLFPCKRWAVGPPYVNGL